MPKPTVKRNAGTPDQLPYGGAEQVNAALPEIDNSELFPVMGFPEESPPLEEDFAYGGDLTGLDSKVFGPTDRPSEPISTGSHWGPGASTLRRGNESDTDFKKRVASEIANSPVASGRTKAWAARLARGE